MPTVTYPGRPLVSYPGLSLLYQLYRSGTLLARLPVWVAAFALSKRARPLPSWTFRQSLTLRILTEYLFMIARVEKQVPLSLEPGKEKDRWVKLEPFPKDLYLGPLASKTVEPALIGGTWYPAKPADPAAAGPMMLHFHGGAFVIGDGRTALSGPMFKLLLEHGKAGAIFAPQYRLSGRPTNTPFPAPLQDAFTSYLYLVRTLGVSPSNITVSGDSAGAALAIALLRYLAVHGAELGIGQPKSAVMVAPPVAPVKFLSPQAVKEGNPHYTTDYLGAELPRWGTTVYMKDVAEDDPYVSLLGHPFQTPVPMLVTFGSGEILGVDGLEWAGEMSAVEGNRLEIYIEPDAPHDTLYFGHILGWKESAVKVAEKIGEFIREHA
ncbi:alpha/beta hydrolase fold-3 domain-containing protein [Nemania sp. FL0031]|nr:alpha/beta hydrolase fold-3 domain-containing protein [Nemania sp. FL0031]